MNEIEIARNSHLIDPHLGIWGWEIPVYLFLGGMTAGIMILSGILQIYPAQNVSRWTRWLPWSAPMALSAGMMALFLDLEYKLHVYRFYTTIRLTSPMSWGSWILLAIYPATLALGIASLSEEEIEKLPVKRILAWMRTKTLEYLDQLRWANILLGIALGAYTGILLGTLGARAAWNTSLLAPLFLASGISSGAAFVMFFPIDHHEHRLVRRIDIAAIVLELALIFLYFVGLVTGQGEAGREVFHIFWTGRFSALFWSLVVIVGLLVPLALEALEERRIIRPTVVAPILLLLGGFSLRWILVAAGQV